MANTDNNMDQYFRERLSSHEVKPSKLAWERLDSQLAHQKKKAAFPWFRVAAIGLLLLALGYTLITVITEGDVEKLDTTASVQQLDVYQGESEKEETKDFQNESAPLEALPSPNQETPKIDGSTVKPSSAKQESIPEFLAEASSSSPEEVIIAVPEIELPELKLNEAVADNSPMVEAEYVPVYRVVIKSYGIKEEPQKQNLIAGIENKVEKIGGFFNKVEQSLADLQDAKENLFDINTAKKEKSPK